MFDAMARKWFTAGSALKEPVWMGGLHGDKRLTIMYLRVTHVDELHNMSLIPRSHCQKF